MIATVKATDGKFEYNLENIDSVYYRDGRIVLIDIFANTYTYSADVSITVH